MASAGLQVVMKLLISGLLQVVSTSYDKSANDMLLQV